MHARVTRHPSFLIKIGKTGLLLRRFFHPLIGRLFRKIVFVMSIVLFFFFFFIFVMIEFLTPFFPIYARFFYTRAKFHGLTFTRFPNVFCERILMSEFKASRQVKNYHVFLNWRSFIYNSWIKNNNFWYTIYFLYICKYFQLFLLVSDYTLPNGKHLKKNAIF